MVWEALSSTTCWRGIDNNDTQSAFLDTSEPNNLGYYERFGFRVTAEAFLPNGVPVWGMTRQPNPETIE